MSALGLNATPAEIMRGCKFSETFKSKQAIVANGGSITGAPAVHFGAVLDGTNDYIAYNSNGQEFNSDNISIVVEFEPDFDYDEDVNRFIFDTSTSLRYYIEKNNNADNNTLGIALGNATIENIPSGTYSPYWLVNQRNILVISSTSGDTNVWLNGNQILTNDVTSWSLKAPAMFYIGTRNDSTNKFKGKINKVQIYNTLLTAQEASDFYTDETYRYMEKAILHLPMEAAQHDPTNVRTLDITNNDNHAQFGDGSTPSTYPAKLFKKGYSFDGGDYMTEDLDITGFTKISAAIMFEGESDNNIRIFSLLHTTPQDDIRIFFDTSNIVNISTDDGATNTVVAYRVGDGVHQCALTFDGTTLKGFMDGVLSGSDNSNDFNFATADGRLTIGANANYSSYYSGYIYHVLIWDFDLTPLQVLDLYFNSIGITNNV